MRRIRNRRLVYVTLALVVLLLTGEAGAQHTPRVFIARPGEGFGPFWIGDPPPPFPDISCRTAALGISKLHYSLLGMSVTVLDPPELSDAKIFAISAAQQVDFFQEGYDGGCIDADGHQILQTATYRLPSSAVYVSSAGVTFGTDVRAVIQAHGSPQGTTYQQGVPRVASLTYCGIAFLFGESGVVDEIVVSRKSALCP